ncbi:EG45-like domain containing protein [Mangifera indica]|uniref:EG45-like domain containing protein n=1 Tax=Mangifera indica TaxID=29780 RepID=UPI001CFB6C9A|nr:EG45-like domain containing protein [Mangifera indica]
MSTPQQLYAWLFMLLSAALFHFSNGGVAGIGTASSYGPPYLPTACYGNDQSQFPSDGLFAAAGEGIWDNGAACGTHYRVRCLSSRESQACIAGGKVVTVKIVDNARTSVSRPSAPSTIALSKTAFTAIANSSAGSLNIEFERV